MDDAIEDEERARATAAARQRRSRSVTIEVDPCKRESSDRPPLSATGPWSALH